MTEVGRVPDFFIIGAPKCGTTALYRYLSEHPCVFLPSLKEPQYFCKDFPGIAQVDSLGEYTALFENAPATLLVGEASAWYLYSEMALKEIMAMNPKAMIIVMLRHPVDMAYSLHSQLISGLREDIDDFEEAWHAQFGRKQGNHLPTFCREPAHLQYHRVCSFPHQLNRLFSNVPSKQVKVLIFERFIREPRRYYLEVLNFLSLQDDGRDFFQVINANKVTRNRVLLKWVRNPPAPVARLYEPGRRISRRLGFRPIKVLTFINAKRAARLPLRSDFRNYLQSVFEPDTQEVERLLGTSLNEWRTCPC